MKVGGQILLKSPIAKLENDHSSQPNLLFLKRNCSQGTLEWLSWSSFVWTNYFSSLFYALNCELKMTNKLEDQELNVVNNVAFFRMGYPLGYYASKNQRHVPRVNNGPWVCVSGFCITVQK